MHHNDRYDQSEEYLRTLDSLDKWELEHKSQDVRGYMLVQPDGEAIGRIDEMLVDREHERIAGVRTEDGRVFPVEPLTIRDDVVIFGEELREPPVARREEHHGKLDKEESIPIVEEKLVVGKRLVDRDSVRVRSRVVEEPVSKTVKLRDEEIDIERRPVDKRVDNAGALFKDRDIQMIETDEEAVVGKEARVKEEVVVRKDADQRVENVSDTVRKTEVDVDRGRDRDRR